MKSIVLSTFLIVAFFAVFSLQGAAQGKEKNEFQKFLSTLDAAQPELQNGKAEAFKTLWSQSDDVSLSGGFGGAVGKGWDSVSRRLDGAGANFSKGKNSIERIVTEQDGKFAYVVQLEHIRFVVPDTGKQTTRDYRVTMIFRR